MRGEDENTGKMFSYVSAERRIPSYGRDPPSHGLSTHSPVESPFASTRLSHERVPCQVEKCGSSL